MDRARVRSALLHAGASDARRRRFDACGTSAWVYQSQEDPTKFRVAADHCHDRFCVPCTRDASLRVARRLNAHLQARRVRFVTLTLKHTDQELGEQLSHLWRSFRRLRNTQMWKEHCIGGAAFFEVTRNRDKAEWHPHLHVLIEGKYFPKQLLQDAWLRASRGSWIVDIRDAGNTATTARYVAAYATKGYAANCLRDEASLPELIQAMDGRRLCITFGSWRGFKLRDEEGPEVWAPLCPLAQLRSDADGGNAWAIALLRHLEHPKDIPPPEHPPPQCSAGRAPVEEGELPGQECQKTLWEMTRDRSLDWCLRA